MIAVQPISRSRWPSTAPGGWVRPRRDREHHWGRERYRGTDCPLRGDGQSARQHPVVAYWVLTNLELEFQHSKDDLLPALSDEARKFRESLAAKETNPKTAERLREPPQAYRVRSFIDVAGLRPGDKLTALRDQTIEKWLRAGVLIAEADLEARRGERTTYSPTGAP